MYGFQCLFQKRALQIIKTVETHNFEQTNDLQRARMVAFLLDETRQNSLFSLKQRIDKRDPALRNDPSFQYIQQANMPKFFPRHSTDTMMQTCSCKICNIWFSNTIPHVTNNFLSQVYKRG